MGARTDPNYRRFVFLDAVRSTRLRAATGVAGGFDVAPRLRATADDFATAVRDVADFVLAAAAPGARADEGAVFAAAGARWVREIFEAVVRGVGGFAADSERFATRPPRGAVTRRAAGFDPFGAQRATSGALRGARVFTVRRVVPEGARPAFSSTSATACSSDNESTASRSGSVAFVAPCLTYGP